jgi:hypothetical protein
VNQRRAWLASLALLAAVVIAVLLRDVVEQVIIRPAAFLLWSLGVLYRIIPQPVLWLALVIVMLYLFLGSVVRKLEWPNFRKNKTRPAYGPVHELSEQIMHKDGGVYFKWQLARTLADIALDIQELRQHIRRRQLEFVNGAANPDVRRYLEAGLNTSFSDYPMTGGLPVVGGFSSAPPTPFDGDISPVIDYLETLMENEDDLKRR